MDPEEPPWDEQVLIALALDGTPVSIYDDLGTPVSIYHNLGHIVHAVDNATEIHG